MFKVSHLYFKYFILYWGFYLTCVQDTKINFLSCSLIRCQSSLKGLRIELLNQFFLYCKLYMRIGSSLLKELYLCIIVLISPLSIMLSISLLQEFTFGQLIHQLSICPHLETLQQTKLRCIEALQELSVFLLSATRTGVVRTKASGAPDVLQRSAEPELF